MSGDNTHINGVDITALPTAVIEEAVIEYVRRLLADGAPGQRYEVFAELAKIMPATCIESVCLARKDGRINLLTLRRPGDDTIWPNMLNSIGSGLMLRSFINERALPDILETFPAKLIEDCKKDPLGWSLDAVDNAIRRTFRRELGFSDELCLKIISEKREVGYSADLTLRGGELVIIFMHDLSDYMEYIPSIVEWIPVDELERHPDYINHQIKRVQRAVELFK